MEYQVLARKFRPRVFDEVVGQGHVTQTLRNALRLGRIHHAFLFTGTRGCGKTSTARILAKALNCQTSGKSLDPCNDCDSCKEIAAGSSLDVLEIDGASNNGVDSIRELRENVRFMPSKGRYKIYVVDEVHMLSTAAFNALLKTLEEPPPHVVFIFATTEPQKLPVTILSRCQRFDFKRIPPKRIAERLAAIAADEKIEISAAGLAALARTAEGSMRDAQSLFDQVISFAGREEGAARTRVTDAQIVESLGLVDRTLVADLLEALAARNARAALDVASRVATAGYDAVTFARELLSRLRDLMVVKVVEDPSALVDLSPEEIETLRQTAARLERQEIDDLFLMLESALEEMTRGSRPQLALEMALLRMATAEPILPVAELVARVEAVAGGTFDGRTRLDAPPPASGARSGTPPTRAESRRDPAPPAERNASPTRPSPPARPEQTDTATVEVPVFDWFAYVKFVAERRRFYGAYLEAASLSRFDGTLLEIASDPESPHGGRIREAEVVSELENLARQFHGGSIQVKIVDHRADRTAERKTASGAKKAVDPSALREEALKSDAIQSAIRELGAHLAEVKPARKG